MFSSDLSIFSEVLITLWSIFSQSNKQLWNWPSRGENILRVTYRTGMRLSQRYVLTRKKWGNFLQADNKRTLKRKTIQRTFLMFTCFRSSYRLLRTSRTTRTTMFSLKTHNVFVQEPHVFVQVTLLRITRTSRTTLDFL